MNINRCLSMRSKIFLNMDLVLNYDILIFLAWAVSIIGLLVVLLGERNAAGSSSPMLGRLVWILFDANFLLSWFWIFMLIVWWLRIYIRHGERIICVICPIIHGGLLILDIILDLAWFLIIQMVLPWTPNICLRWRIWSFRFLLFMLRSFHVPSLVEMLYILISLRRMLRFGTHWPKTPLRFTRIFFRLHFYTLLGILLIHRFIVEWLH